MITLLAGLAMAAPCLDTDLDEITDIGGPTFEILPDGALQITIPTDDYWGAWHCGHVSMRALAPGAPTLPAAWLGGLEWFGINLPDGYNPISRVTIAADADPGIGIIEMGDGRTFRTRVLP